MHANAKLAEYMLGYNNGLMLKLETPDTEQLITAIASDGYAVIEDFLPAAIIGDLVNEALALQSAGSLRKALTGRDQFSNAVQLRDDLIHWLDTPTSTAQQAYLQAMQSLRESLNQALYLGLFEFETHFAIYPAGGGYSKHLDQIRGSEARQVSSILYLNQHWPTDDGGELRLYLDESSHRDIVPTGGKLVIFLSKRFWHEVLPAKRQRISLTGWFRTRDINPL